LRRSELDICADILRTTRTGAKKTHIVYRANLNFKIIKRYLHNLISQDLIAKDGDHYRTTSKGAHWLAHFEELRFITPLPETPVFIT